MTDLLSCPFCGGAAEVYYGLAAQDGTHVYCTECEIRTEGYKTKAGSTWDVDAAITAWNRRALPAVQSVTAQEAADRIEALTAERDMALAEWDDCVERNRPRSAADTTAMTDLIAEIEFEAVNGEIDRHLAGWIITAMRALTAERDRLREALEQIEITCEEEIHARTAGMSDAALGKSRILPLLQIPRNIARAALKGETP